MQGLCPTSNARGIEYIPSRATHSSAAVRMQDDSGSCSEFDERVTTKRTESSDYAKSTLVRKRDAAVDKMTSVRKHLVQRTKLMLRMIVWNSYIRNWKSTNFLKYIDQSIYLI